MRRKEKTMPEADALRILKEAEFGTLATVGADGYPYAVVLNYALDGNAIYFHTAHDGHKVSNIDFCENVCFSVVGYHKLLAEKSILNMIALSYSALRAVWKMRTKRKKPIWG